MPSNTEEPLKGFYILSLISGCWVLVSTSLAPSFARLLGFQAHVGLFCEDIGGQAGLVPAHVPKLEARRKGNRASASESIDHLDDTRFCLGGGLTVLDAPVRDILNIPNLFARYLRLPLCCTLFLLSLPAAPARSWHLGPSKPVSVHSC